MLLIGAIKGATSRQTLGLLDTWLRLIKDVHRLHKDDLDMIDVRIYSNLRVPHIYIPTYIHTYVYTYTNLPICTLNTHT